MHKYTCRIKSKNVICILCQRLPLGGGILIRPQYIFVLGILLIQRSRPNLKQPHLEPRSHFVQRHLLPISSARLGVHVMAEANEVIVVAKRHDPSCIGLGHWEQTFQDVTDALAQLGMEIIQYNVRIGLRHGVGPPWQIVTQYGTTERKEGGGTQRQVTHHQPIGLTPGFLHHNNVGEFRLLARRYQLIDPIVAAIDSRGVGDEQLDFLGELLEAAAGIAAGRHAHHGFGQSGIAVLVVNVIGLFLRLGILGIHFRFQRVVAGPNFRGEGLAGRQRLADDALLLVRGLVASLEAFAVQIFATETRLTTRRGGLGGGGHDCGVVGFLLRSLLVALT